jgi:tetratricopeptide (TPR) repeat protein
METTPLELYETAYRFHYHDNRLPDAVAYYQKLIKEFPDSNECGYAVIQLQKIKEHEVAEGLQTLTRPRSSLHPLVIITLIFALCAIGAAGYSFKYFNQKIIAEQKRNSLALSALGKTARKEYKEALVQLEELKKIHPDDITPYELVADIFRKQHKFDEARNEYTIFFQKNPGRTPFESEIKYMSFKENSVMNKPVVNPVPQDSLQKPPPALPAPGIRKKNIRTKAKLMKPPPPGSAPGKGTNGLFLVDPDSISYF